MRFFLLAGLALASAPSLAQNGPGGVGGASTNVLWLDASYGVTAPTLAVMSWADRSGNGNTAAQTTANLMPAYLTNTINGYPTVQFDNDQAAADYLRVPDNATLEGMSGLTAFCVYQLATGTTDITPRGIFSKRNGPDNQEAYAWFFYNGGGASTNRNQTLDMDGTGNRINSSTTFGTGTTYVNSFVYDGSAPSNVNDQTLYDGNTAVGNGIETSTSIPNYSSDLYIGILRGHTGSGSSTTRFNGYMSEVIIYNYAMGSAQRTIVNNYLAAKYGTTLASNDLYVQDNAGNGNYDHDVAGIGRISSTDLQIDSRGSGIVEMSNPTNLDNNEFFFWGHNNGSLTTIGNTDYPSGLQGRWNRKWRVSEVTTSAATTDVGGVDITFHLAGLGPVVASDLRLLVDVNGNGVFADETAISGATSVGGGKYKFSNVTAIANGMQFTLGTINTATTPLPIELLSFSATAMGEDVRLVWTTASERDNDHFTVERSTDGEDWTAVAQMAGAGNSTGLLTYETMDTSPLFGTAYYRLRQTDMDGSSTVSAAVVVHRDRQDGAVIFPNPSTGAFTVLFGYEASSVSLSDAQGRTVPTNIRYQPDRAVVDATGLPQGIYYIRTGEEDAPSFHRVVISPALDRQ